MTFVTAICSCHGNMSVTVTFTVTNLDHRDLILHVSSFFCFQNSKQNAKMPAFAETQVESGFDSCLKSASDLISICRKSANFSRLLIIQVLWDKMYFQEIFQGEIRLISLFCLIV